MMTLEEKYYEINRRLISYLKSIKVDLPVIQAGVNVARIRTGERDQSKAKYPYLQTFVTNIKTQSWTTRMSGILTFFDFHLSFFTAPGSEYKNNAKYFYPFQVAKDAFNDIQIHLLKDLATIVSTTGHNETGLKSGQATPAGFMVYKMQAACSYRAIVEQPGKATDIDNAIDITAE
jgi:hypothetical protein